MRVLEKARDIFRKFRCAPPGQRFTMLYARVHRRQSGSLVAGVSVGLGVLLILLGAALSLVPLVPGILVALFGLGLIATQSRRFARGCDHLERVIRSKFT
jgi:uncharacterized membrane protein